ncbi:unnamed protein product, partial [Choristocarpus tenellus]
LDFVRPYDKRLTSDAEDEEESCGGERETGRGTGRGGKGKKQKAEMLAEVHGKVEVKKSKSEKKKHGNLSGETEQRKLLVKGCGKAGLLLGQEEGGKCNKNESKREGSKRRTRARSKEQQEAGTTEVPRSGGRGASGRNCNYSQHNSHRLDGVSRIGEGVVNISSTKKPFVAAGCKNAVTVGTGNNRRCSYVPKASAGVAMEQDQQGSGTGGASSVTGEGNAAGARAGVDLRSARLMSRKEKGEEGDDPDLPLVTNVEEMRLFFRREGSIVGHDRCMWADDFAHLVVAERLRLAILFVDMEREKNAWPYRVLAKCRGEPERYVVLKREGPVGHFVLITMLVGAVSDTNNYSGSNNSDICVGGKGGSVGQDRGKGSGQGGRRARRVLCCFTLSELPDVIKSLW